jgi:AcrR family transcriptional regulator
MAKLPSVSFQRDMRVEDRIIDATVKCFQSFGISKTSMDDIAKLAKVSRPTIYRYFPSRHHLAVEVLVREVRDHTRLVSPILREIKYPPKAMLEGVVLAVSTAREHPYTRIVLSDAGAELLARVPGTDQALLDAMGEQWLPSMTRLRESGYLKPSVRLDDLLLWITFYMQSSIGKADFMAITEERMRRMLRTLLIPSVFDFEKLEADFPGEAM